MHIGSAEDKLEVNEWYNGPNEGQWRYTELIQLLSRAC